MVTIDIDVISFQLAEHDHPFGTLDALVRLAFAPDWSLSWRESAGRGFDIGDLTVIAYHIFVGRAAVIGDPEGGADTTAWRALRQVRGDVEVGYSFVGSAGPQLSVNGQKKTRATRVLVLGCENDEILESDLADVILVGDGKGVAGCIWENNH